MKPKSYYPPQRTLMGPGPSDVSPRVLAAMARSTIGHLDPAFVTMMEEIKAMLQYAFQTRNRLTFPVSAPGSAGMETCFVNLIEPGDKVIVCQNGVFGGRMKENVLRTGGTPIMIEDPWGRAVDPQKVEDALKANPDARIVAFVHAETSTGARSDARLLAEIAHRHEALIIADAVTSLGGIPLLVDEWRLDAVYSGTQKCLSCVPGLSPVTFGERAMERIKGRRHRIQSWFLDLGLVMSYWSGDGKRTYHHTAPVNTLYALHEALVMLREETLGRAWARHAYYHRALRAGIEAMGLRFVVPEAERLPQLNAIQVPEGVDDALVRAQLLGEYHLEIGAGLGAMAGKVWRIGLMGQACTARNVLLCLGALEDVLSDFKAPIRRDAALDAARAVMNEPPNTMDDEELD